MTCKRNRTTMAERQRYQREILLLRLRKFRKESYDQMQIPAVTENPTEISFFELAAPASEKVASIHESTNSTTTAIIRHGAVTLEISNDISEDVLSLLLKEVIHA